jgi:phenylacetate-CoA ligase
MFGALKPRQALEQAFAIYQAALAAPFYAAKYAACVPPTDAASWQALPLLTHAELYANTYPRTTGMLTQPVVGMIVLSTGGTSGVARYTLMTHVEWDRFIAAQAEAMRLLGVVPSDRVANLFVAGHLWPSFLGVHDVVRYLGAVHLPISANIPPEEFVRLCAEFDPTVMVSLPTAFIFLADLGRKAGYRFPSLRLIGYVGEQMSEEAQRHVRGILGDVQIKPLAYSSADAGLMGYQCERAGFGTYHLPTDFQYVEILDPESHVPSPVGQVGEVVVTNLARRSMPIVRYQMGDLASWQDGACACGDPNPLFRLAGRAGDDFKIGGGFIAMRVFDQALEAAGAAVSLNYVVELEDLDNQVDIRLRVEAPDPAAARGLAGSIREAVCERAPLIAEGLEKAYIREFTVQFVPLGALPRSPITGKVKRLEDKRVIADTAPARS